MSFPIVVFCSSKDNYLFLLSYFDMLSYVTRNYTPYKHFIDCD